MPFWGFLISQAMTLFSKRIKSLATTFYLYLAIVYKSRDKQFINMNYLKAEIRKVKCIEKGTALSNSKETITFIKKMAHNK